MLYLQFDRQQFDTPTRMNLREALDIEGPVDSNSFYNFVRRVRAEISIARKDAEIHFGEPSAFLSWYDYTEYNQILNFSEPEQPVNASRLRVMLSENSRQLLLI
jgi:hypothetical protein